MTDQLKQLSEAIYARDLDGTGSMHICSMEDEGAVELVPTSHLETATLGERLLRNCKSKPATIPWPHRILHEANDRIESLEAQLTEAKAREAVAYEVAAQIPLDWLRDYPAAETRKSIALSIRALTSDHTTTALEQIKQEARGEGKREFEADLKKVATVLRNRQPDKLPDALHIVNAILATLSEPKENSDE